MIGRPRQLAVIRFAWSRAALVASASLLFCGLLPAQNAANDLFVPLPWAAKAGMPVAETALNVEKNYHALLIAQRQLAAAKANGQTIHGAQLLASSAVAPGELSASGEKPPETGSRL